MKTVKVLDNDRIHKALAVANTTWKFNPPYDLHFGGVWQGLIQSVKIKLLLILRSRRFSFDTFLTIMPEKESILNSRPLANVARQTDNEEPLTSNYFLIQRPFNSLRPGQFGNQQPASLKTWLTPNHFLIQRPFNSLPPGQFGDQQSASLKT